MHGIIGVASTASNRRGRKRKQRVTVANMQAQEPKVDYRAMAALQPHRVGLPEKFRGYEEAGTVLGSLLLTGRLGKHGKDGKPSEQALKRFQAGQRYADIVALYRAVIGTPVAVASSGGGYECFGAEGCDSKSCECLRRKQAYNDAFNAVSDFHLGGGQRVAKIVKTVAVHDEAIPDDEIPILVIGLGILAKHFGLGH